MSDQGPNDPGTPPTTPPQWGQQPPPPQPGQPGGQPPPPQQPSQQWGQQPPPPQQPGQQWGQPPAQPPAQQWGQQPGAVQQPGQPGQQWGQQPGAGTAGGLDPKIAGILAYVPFSWLGGLVVYLVNKDPLSRFHGAQSILLSIVAIGYFIASTILQIFMPGIIDLILFLIGLVVWLGWFVASVYLAIQGYNLKKATLPVIGDMAEQWATK